MKMLFGIRIALIALGSVVSAYGLITMFSMNFSLGQVALLLGGLLFLFGGLFLKILLARLVLKILFFAALVFILLFSVLGIFLYCYGNNDTATGSEDVVIVLGCGIKGETVSRSLAARLDSAFEYWKTNQNALIVVSGGQGSQEKITEALAMERYLLEKGVPAEKILKEEESVSTYTNFVNTKKLLDSRFENGYKAVVVTNDYHIYRAMRIAKEVGVDCTHVHASTGPATVPVAYSRECLAVLKNWVFGG